MGLFSGKSRAMKDYANESRTKANLRSAVSEVRGYQTDTAGHGPPRHERAHDDKPKQE